MFFGNASDMQNANRHWSAFLIGNSEGQLLSVP